MASNLVFTADKTEIGEQQSFSIRRTASDIGNIWDASLPWDSISDCIMTLTSGFASPAGTTVRGAIYQVRNIDGSHRPQSKLQWLDTDGQEYILSIFYDELPYLVSVLTELAEFEGIPLDLDESNLTEISPNNRFDVQLSNALKNPETLFRKRVVAIAQQNSSDVTDETVAGWFEDEDSFTRQFLDGQYAAKSTVNALSSTVSGLSADVLEAEASITDLETLTQSGRLSENALDAHARSIREARTGRVRVDDYTGADDSARANAAIADAITRGLGGVEFAGRDYIMTTAVVIPPVSGFEIVGVADKTFFRMAPGGYLSSLFVISGDSGQVHENIKFRGLSIHGGMSNIAALGTQRARGQGFVTPVPDSPEVTYSYRIVTGILARGDMSEYWNSAGDQPNPYGRVKNIDIVDCNFIGTSGLPVFFQGVRGYSRLLQSYLLRCLDPGWVYCEVAQFSDNLSEFSMDNGVSLSRGCISAICSNNVIRYAWSSAIWVAGFAQSAPAAPAIGLKSAGGPTRATITGNIVEWPGAMGIQLSDASAAATITVTGNTIVNCIPVSSTSTTAGLGIEAGPLTGAVPQALTIVGNSITTCRRGGILASGFRAINISNNSLSNTSRQFYQDGVTERTGNDQRFGIASGTDTPIAAPSMVAIIGNILSNTTGTQANVLNPIYYPGSVGRMIQNNIANNSLNPLITANNA